MTDSRKMTLIAAAMACALGFAIVPALSATTAVPTGTTEAAVPAPLSADEMEVLVARIALYPDELVALISAASLYPLQIVEAQRFLDESKSNKDLKPKQSWDGSVVSLLNYAEIVKMMSDDLDWTQSFAEAILNQQNDVLLAIQQLREQALANGVVKSDDKVTVSKEQDNIVIEPASKEVIYVPQYPPEMLYEENYGYAPVTYYPDPYPYYYDPGAAFFAGAITGAFWAAAIDWDDGFWGGDWNDWGGDLDLDIDCNNCIIGGDFNGKLNLKDTDWHKIDRSKINFDRSQLKKIDNTKLKNGFKGNDRNKLTNKPALGGGNRPSALPGKGSKPAKDVRASTLEGLKRQPGPKPSNKLPGSAGSNKLKPSDTMAKPGQGVAQNRKDAGNNRPSGKKKAGAKVDSRAKSPSPLGDVNRGAAAKKQSNRGAQSMGGGYKKPSGGQPNFKRPSGGGSPVYKKRPRPQGGGGRGGGGRGGGGGRRGR